MGVLRGPEDDYETRNLAHVFCCKMDYSRIVHLHHVQETSAKEWITDRRYQLLIACSVCYEC